MVKIKKQDLQEVRKILDVWLVVCPKTGPHYLSNIKEKAVLAHAALAKSGLEPQMTKITAHKQRVLEIGYNLTNKELKEAAMNIINSGISLLSFRNEAVRKTHADGDWAPVRKELNIPDITYEEMNQWLMDFMRYYTKELE